MFTGCSHAGVVNASRHGAQLGSGAPLYAVVGGYHLADAETEQIEETVKGLKALAPKLLLPGHCSGWRVKQAIEIAMPGSLAPSTFGTKFTY
jgi:7,8-dihydropterin-6-yl-methyl-4-(beta-D-ribofuranosyl)aminobenzene 5'-phosphate synthase